MCDIDNEHLAFQNYTWRTARRHHECFACHETIQPGHRYHVTVGKCDGDFATLKHCARCWHMCEALWGRGVEWVNFRLACGETWESAFEEAPPPEVAALAFALPGDFVEASA